MIVCLYTDMVLFVMNSLALFICIRTLQMFRFKGIQQRSTVKPFKTDTPQDKLKVSVV